MKCNCKNEGSITLEAALVMPIFVFFVVFLIFMIKFTLTDIALNRAVTETAKQIATQAYPVDRTAREIGGAIQETEAFQEVSGSIKELEAEIADVLGEETYQDFIIQPAKSAGKFMIDTATNAVIKKIVQNYLTEAENYGFVESENIEVEAALWGNDNFIEITVNYQVNLPIPFIEKDFHFTKKAYERLWLGT